MKTILVIGKGGQLSNVIQNLNLPLGWQLLCKTKSELNLLKIKKLKNKINFYRPNVIINVGAFTRVDLSENFIGSAYKINGYSMRNISLICKEMKIILFHVSTDSVFNSNNKFFFDERSLVKPCNIYSKSKYLGEVLVRKNLKKSIILRVSWIFSSSENNFVRKIINQKNNSDIKVTSMETGSPTPAEAIANTILKMILTSYKRKNSSFFGIFHFVGSPIISRDNFAQKILDIYGSTKKISSIPRAYNKTRRPNKSLLSCKKIERIYKIKQPLWLEYLKKSIEEIKKC